MESQKRAITLVQAREIVERLQLVVGDTFSSPSLMDVDWGYRMETGYWLSFANSRLVHFSTTKNDDGERVTTAHLEFNLESLGISEDEPTEDQKERAKPIARVLSEILGDSFIVEMPPK